MTKNSGLADSPFFSLSTPAAPSSPGEEPLPVIPPPPPEHVPPSPQESQSREKDSNLPRMKKKIPVNQPRNLGTKIPTNRDTTVSRYHNTVVEILRKAVKEFGKEAATYRFSTDEKQATKDIIYTYGRLGITTSGNEITRIGLNFLIYDYKENGENSLLHKVLTELNK